MFGVHCDVAILKLSAIAQSINRESYGPSYSASKQLTVDSFIAVLEIKLALPTLHLWLQHVS